MTTISDVSLSPKRASTTVSNSVNLPSIEKRPSQISIQINLLPFNQEETKNQSEISLKEKVIVPIQLSKDLKTQCKEVTKLAESSNPKKTKEIKKHLELIRQSLQKNEGYDQGSFEIVCAYLNALYAIPTYVEYSEGIIPDIKLIKYRNIKFNKPHKLISDYLAQGKVEEYLKNSVSVLPEPIRNDLADNVANFLVYDKKADRAWLKDSTGGLIDKICLYSTRPSTAQLFAASLRGDNEMVEKCLKSLPIPDLYTSNPVGITPFLLAMMKRKFSTSDLFIQAGLEQAGQAVLDIASNSKEMMDYVNTKKVIKRADSEKFFKRAKIFKEFSSIEAESIKESAEKKRYVAIESRPEFFYNARHLLQGRAIASESPTPKRNSVLNFWQMIVHTHSSVIVMLMDTNEHATSPSDICSLYWPEVGVTKEYDNVLVTAKKAEMIFLSDKHTIVKRIFDITDLGEVTQLQVMNWKPEQLIDSIVLAELINKVGEILSNFEKKHVNIAVHGPEKSGRSELFLAAYAAHIERESGNNDPDLIRKVTADVNRNSGERIKSAEQYYLIHQTFNAMHPEVPDA